ncbi:MAG: hypothetical protein ACI8U3_000099 [Brevundimonas sp.]|jgi:hypothetical protein|uniref:hypothetical protein n=1 Tax=Brevundimonas sp. TaxID=1871086 RepID=UPI0039E38F19
MSPASPVQSLARRWKSLGAPTGVENALVFGPQGADLARAVQTALSPGSLTLLHPDPPPPRARFRTDPATLTDLAAVRPGAFDLIVAGGGLEIGGLSQVRSRLAALAELLTEDGVLAAEIQTFAAPGPDEDFDALLFPHLARAGELEDGRAARAPLTAASWTLLLRSAGLHPAALDGVGAQRLPQELGLLHSARLAAYDPVELSTGALRLVARKAGGAA